MFVIFKTDAQIGNVIRSRAIRPIFHDNYWRWGIVESKNAKNGSLKIRTGLKQITTITKSDAWSLGMYTTYQFEFVPDFYACSFYN